MSKLPKQMSSVIGMKKDINKILGFGSSKKRKPVSSKARKGKGVSPKH
jgi:hypothetical protein